MEYCSEGNDGTKPVTAHSIQRIRALFDRDKQDTQHQSHQPHHYIYPYQSTSMSPSEGIQMKQEAMHPQQSGETQYYPSPRVGDRADDRTTDSQTSDGRVAPDSIKEGWLNCKISNIDGKVNKVFTRYRCMIDVITQYNGHIIDVNITGILFLEICRSLMEILLYRPQKCCHLSVQRQKKCC